MRARPACHRSARTVHPLPRLDASRGHGDRRGPDPHQAVRASCLRAGPLVGGAGLFLNAVAGDILKRRRPRCPPFWTNALLQTGPAAGLFCSATSAEVRCRAAPCWRGSCSAASRSVTAPASSKRAGTTACAKWWPAGSTAAGTSSPAARRSIAAGGLAVGYRVCRQHRSWPSSPAAGWLTTHLWRLGREGERGPRDQCRRDSCRRRDHGHRRGRQIPDRRTAGRLFGSCGGWAC